MPLSPENREMLARAYRATSYFVDGPSGRFAVRIGAVSLEADALAAAHGASAWAYVTAYNPGSVPASIPAVSRMGAETGRWSLAGETPGTA